MTRLLAVVFVFMLAGAAAATSLKFDISDTESCLQIDSEHLSPLTCIGKAASKCMEVSVGGSTTVGMGGCLDLERAYWDKRLNTAYIALQARLDEIDAGTIANDDNAPLQMPALRAMQRAWIPFRDATCDLERSFWGGGTGGGPATIGCLMYETGEQTLVLEQMLRRATR